MLMAGLLLVLGLALLVLLLALLTLLLTLLLALHLSMLLILYTLAVVAADSASTDAADTTPAESVHLCCGSCTSPNPSCLCRRRDLGTKPRELRGLL